jgi:hypothetical protein
LLRHNYEKELGNICDVDGLFFTFRVEKPTALNAMNYIRIRSRGTPRRLANLFIAAHLLPDGLFDWNSCFRGDEREQLMMFGIQEMEPEVFNEWVDLYEEFGDC